MLNNLFVFDCEVFAHDWVFVFKNTATDEYTVIHNDNDVMLTFYAQADPFLVGYNNKNYDQFILKAVLNDMSPEEVKHINDLLIVHEIPGWNIPDLRDSYYFDQFDLMDDTQFGTSLKDIEGHLGMNIRETTVPFNIDRPLTDKEVDEVIYYCKHDVDATHILLKLRDVYIQNKLTLGKEKGIEPAKALYMTNAKLTAAYLDAKMKEHNDEREYVFPDDILWEYIPKEVREFYEKIHDLSIPDEELFEMKLDIMVGECKTRLAYGGIHGSINNYSEEGGG